MIIIKGKLLIDQHDKNFMYGGKFGGNFVPETLKKPIDDLTKLFAKLRKDKKDIEAYKKVEDGSDIILWDSTGFEKSLGWNHNWIKNIKIKGEKMIGGNITKDKLGELSKFADIIDVSGALETNKVKDINKIKNFVKQIKKINNEN